MTVGQLQKMLKKYRADTPIELEIGRPGKRCVKIQSAHVVEGKNRRIEKIVFSPLYDIFPLPE